MDDAKVADLCLLGGTSRAVSHFGDPMEMSTMEKKSHGAFKAQKHVLGLTGVGLFAPECPLEHVACFYKTYRTITRGQCRVLLRTAGFSTSLALL